MANRLAATSSPYLRQHAENPVDWYPWGEEAFARARAEDLPILLSVGYSACHWCHVMAHESFENPATAELMNRWFVNVKVDREERPDVDAVYMSATQALTGQGGWPMTVFLTPDLEPFYAGTYFPPQDGHGRPGFPRLLEALHEAWSQDRATVLENSQAITAHLRGLERGAAAPGLEIDIAAAAGAVAAFERSFDRQWGGFGGAPKFPSPSNLEFLLAHAARTGSAPALTMASTTLRGMAAGGMYDHLGGGFARYSVDARWLVPHFEKMLYDNAQLARTYLHAWQLTGAAPLREVVESTLDYLVREMRDPAGGFYSATDADSEGIEGKYFVWTPGELEAVLGADEAELFAVAYAVTAEGNFQDPHHPEFGRRSVLSAPRSFDEVARDRGLEGDVVQERLARSRALLLAERARRVAPGLDYKLQTSWNGLALQAFAEAGRVLQRDDWRRVAVELARFVERELWDAERGRLLHIWTEGVASVAGMLEDYAWFGLGLVELYKATGDLHWLRWAARLLEVVVERFHDAAGGGFFATPDDAEALLFREKPVFDGPTPSGTAAAGQLAWWLGRYFDRDEWLQLAGECLRVTQQSMLTVPNGFGAAWQLAELMLATPRELAIIGQPAARREFEVVAAGRWLPALLLAPATEGRGLPLLEGKLVASGSTAWLCEAYACQLPAQTAAQLAEQLAALP